ncbi:type II toxin-antitoxin system VapC family toxin [Salinivirga cyanobacteriivorans]
MNLLLDSHALLWYISGSDKLPDKIINTINNKSNKCFVSIASIWEIAIKLSLNRLTVEGGFQIIEKFFYDNDFSILDISFQDINTIIDLEFHHRDPFDRIIIAQAIQSQLTIVSKDQFFQNYNIKLMW